MDGLSYCPNQQRRNAYADGFVFNRPPSLSVKKFWAPIDESMAGRAKNRE
jgi:hypothetical protein